MGQGNHIRELATDRLHHRIGACHRGHNQQVIANPEAAIAAGVSFELHDQTPIYLVNSSALTSRSADRCDIG